MTSALGGRPKGHERRNQQPEQSFHEEEKKSPKAEPLNPLSYWHSGDYRTGLDGASQEISGRCDSFREPCAW